MNISSQYLLDSKPKCFLTQDSILVTRDIYLANTFRLDPTTKNAIRLKGQKNSVTQTCTIYVSKSVQVCLSRGEEYMTAIKRKLNKA